MIAGHLALAAVASLAHHKLRAALTALGMVFGVGAVVAMLAISEGARGQALAAIRDLGLDNVLVASQRPTAVAASNQKKPQGWVQSYGLTFADRARLRSEVPDLVGVLAARSVTAKVYCGTKRIDAPVLAVEPAWSQVAHLEPQRGRWLCDLDQERSLAVAVLGPAAARQLFPLQDPLGAPVQVGNQWFTVVGILRQPTGGGADLQARTIYIPEAAARNRFGLVSIEYESGSFQAARVELSQLVLRFAPGTDVAARGVLVRRILVERPEPRQDVTVTVPIELLESQRRTQRIFAIVMGSIASISLLVGGIGIMNIMLATVLERTREIGIRRAVGARRRDILAQFLVETVVLCLAGGLIGLGMGVGLAEVAGQLAGWPVEITLWSVVMSGGICLVVGVVFGLYPAAKAARMQPVEALRHA